MPSLYRMSIPMVSGVRSSLIVTQNHADADLLYMLAEGEEKAYVIAAACDSRQHGFLWQLFREVGLTDPGDCFAAATQPLLELSCGEQLLSRIEGAVGELPWLVDGGGTLADLLIREASVTFEDADEWDPEAPEAWPRAIFTVEWRDKLFPAGLMGARWETSWDADA